MTHEVEGSHAIISAQLARRYYGRRRASCTRSRRTTTRSSRRPWRRCCSSGRRDLGVAPGCARREPRELHQAARETSKSSRAARPRGGEGLRAAGRREIRVIVKPEEVDDDTAVLLSHEIRAAIEDQARVSRSDQGDGDPREPREPTSRRTASTCAATRPRRRSTRPRCAWRARGRTEADEHRARADPNAVRRRRSAPAIVPRGKRVERVADEAERQEEQAEDQDLRPDGAAAGVHELRQEREEETARSSVEHVHDPALHEELAVRPAAHRVRQRKDRARAAAARRRRRGRRRPRA